MGGDLLSTSRDTLDAIREPSAVRPDLQAASAQLSAGVRQVRDAFRAEAGVPDAGDGESDGGA